jgi:hypothetical protein
MSKLILIVFCFLSAASFAQEISSSAKSSVPDSTAYFINGKFTTTQAVKFIPQDSIKSIHVIKRDTLVNKQKYGAQIFVILKSRKED